MDDRTVVCGLDRLGLRIALALRALGEPVTVIAEAPGPGLPREAPAAGAKVVEGSAEDIGQLDEVDLRAAGCHGAQRERRPRQPAGGGGAGGQPRVLLAGTRERWEQVRALAAS